MLDNKSFTVIITTYKRFKTLESILEAWKKEPVEEVWLIDGSGNARPKVGGILLFSMPKDFGTKMDYTFATLTDTDFVILADDDVLPKQGFVKDLYEGWKKVGGLVGTIGRDFHGPDYRKDSTFYKANQINQLTKTDFVGVVILSPREYFGFDSRGVHNNLDDLHLSCVIHREVQKHVVPSKNFEDLPDCQNGMFHNKEYAAIRQRFYENLWNTYYSKTKQS